MKSPCGQDAESTEQSGWWAVQQGAMLCHPELLFLKRYQSFTQKSPLRARRAWVFYMLRMQTWGLPENQCLIFAETRRQTGISCLNVYIGRFQSAWLLGASHLGKDKYISKSEEENKTSKYLEPCWNYKVWLYSLQSKKKKTLIKLCGSLWAKFCHAGMLMLPLYFETKLSYTAKRNP